MPVKMGNRASSIRNFISNEELNGDDPITAYRKAFNDFTSSDEEISKEVTKTKRTDFYKKAKESVLNGFMDRLNDEAQKAAVNFLNKYNAMLDEGDRFIKQSDGEMKLKAFANQRALLESNPFSVLENLKSANETKALPSGRDDDYEEGVIID